MGQKQEADQKIPGQPTNRLAPAHDTKVTCYSRLRVRTHTYTHVCRHTLKHMYMCMHTHTHICTHNTHCTCVHTTSLGSEYRAGRASLSCGQRLLLFLLTPRTGPASKLALLT